MRSESSVGQVSPALSFDEQCHMRSRPDAVCSVTNPRSEACHSEADSLQHVLEKAVLLEAIAAPSVGHQLLLQARGVEQNAPLQQHVDVLEGDVAHVGNVKRT